MTTPLDDAAFVESITGRHMLSNEEIDRLVALARDGLDLARAVNESASECAPSCDAEGHDAVCPRTTTAQWLIDLRRRLADMEAQLGNLLAVIHRDGGHYAAKHGQARAAQDAEARILAERLQCDNAEARVREVEETLREVKRHWGVQSA